MLPPKTWKKCGDVFFDTRNKCIYVCSICLENVEHIYFPFNTSDASDFWKHIQQHISADREILKEPLAKKSHTEIQQQHCDGRISLAADCNMNKNADLKNSHTVDQVQDKIKLLDKFHENLVGSFGKTDHNNKEAETKEPQQVGAKIETQIEANEIKMETQITIKNGSVFENTSVLNKDQQINQNCKNYSYDNDNEIYTISDDDDDDDDDEDEDNEEGNNDLLSAIKAGSVRDYLAHNDMIELSDDEEDGLDEVDTRPHSPQSAKNDKENNTEKQTEVVNNVSLNSGYSYNCLSCRITFPNRNVLIDHLTTHEIEANSQQNTPANDTISCIPTPAASPNDVINSQNKASNLQPYQCNYCPQRFCEVWQLDRHQRLHLSNLESKRKFKLRPFQCNFCGKRTTTEKNMIIHQRRFHSPEYEIGTTLCEICQKQILSKEFQHHMMLHSESNSKKLRPFQCKDCRRRTSSQQAMKIHKDRFHNPESGYYETTLCEICQKRVLIKNLQQHNLVHTQCRYKCDHCDQTYKQKQTLRKHIYKFHPNSTINNNPAILNLAANQAPYSNQLRQNDNVEISPQPLLGSSQVSQPHLTPEEEELLHSFFLQYQGQNKEQYST